eukprot:TRINITY_DN841_c0_g2_i5.p1 TRINITY_DN841_c0_g2~~TRINITY_DN841_c0_g2_i5.p1  ORF type:complete len:119 (-),score=28.31 TRINITY_DN841_c0_g2_i5:804-1160(-)
MADDEGGSMDHQQKPKAKGDLFFYLWEPENIHERCIFCKISSGKDPKTTLLHQDEDCACFEDINPAAKAHLLVVPRAHFKNWSHFGPEHKDLVLHMAKVGKECLEKKAGRKLDPSEYK